MNHSLFPRGPAQTAAAAWRAVQDQWAGRSLRERLALASLGAVAILAALHVGVYQPLRAARSDALRILAQGESVLARTLSEGAQLPLQIAAPPALSTAEQAAQLDLLINRIEPDGPRTTLTLEDAEFSRLMVWLSNIEEQGAGRITALSIERLPEPGRVAATITLEMAP